jgi:hypothetical protein
MGISITKLAIMASEAILAAYYHWQEGSLKNVDDDPGSDDGKDGGYTQGSNDEGSTIVDPGKNPKRKEFFDN